MTDLPSLAVDIARIKAAAARLLGQAVRTPLLRSRDLEAVTGATAAFIKPEVLQRTGSFKGCPTGEDRQHPATWCRGRAL